MWALYLYIPRQGFDASYVKPDGRVIRNDFPLGYQLLKDKSVLLKSFFDASWKVNLHARFSLDPSSDPTHAVLATLKPQ
jgi:hypothetical protein